MVRECQIDKVSYKTRKVLIGKDWTRIGPEFDLRDVRFGNIYRLEVTQDLEGNYIVQRILKDNEPSSGV